MFAPSIDGNNPPTEMTSSHDSDVLYFDAEVTSISDKSFTEWLHHERITTPSLETPGSLDTTTLLEPMRWNVPRTKVELNPTCVSRTAVTWNLVTGLNHP